jgi:hypothetical protein
MKTVPITSAAELRRSLSAWCAARPGGNLHLSMTVGTVRLTVRGGSHLGVASATCAGLLAEAPSAQTLAQAGRLALGNATRYAAGLALDESGDRLWLSHTLHDPSTAQICNALSVLHAQVRSWQRTLAAQARREQSPARTRSAPLPLPSTVPASWSMRR